MEVVSENTELDNVSRGLLAASPDAVTAEESEEEPVLPAACSRLPALVTILRHGEYCDSQQLTPQAPRLPPHQGLLTSPATPRS